MKKTTLLFIVFFFFFSFYIVYDNFIKKGFVFGHRYVYDINNFDTSSSDINLKAGKTLQFRFHNSYDDEISICELHVPKNYSKDKEIPIFVWFAPGNGSYSVKNVPALVDFDEYFILALPYLNNQLPRLAIQGGNIDQFWEYDKPMFEYVIDNIPNLSEDVRIAAGFSSGAHFVSSALDRDWIGFTDFFTGYIIHEGGGAPQMTYKGIKPFHKILITYGDSYNSYGKLVADMMKQVRKDITVYAVPNTKHELNSQSIEYIKEWINETF